MPKIHQKMIVKFKQASIFYTDKGQGSCVVLLHGFLENSTMWKTIEDTLVKKNRVISIDLLGHGKTGCIGYIHTMDEMAEAVKTVLKKLRIRRITLIGHSMGGYVSLAFAEKYPKFIKKICLLNSTAQADNEARKKLRLRANKIAQENYKALVQMSISNLFAASVREDLSDIIQEVKNHALQTSVRGYIAGSDGMRLRENKETVLQSIEKRLLITGKEDAILPYKMIVEEAERTNTPLVTLPNGHMSHLEATTALIAVLNKFIKG